MNTNILQTRQQPGQLLSATRRTHYTYLAVICTDVYSIWRKYITQLTAYINFILHKTAAASYLEESRWRVNSSLQDHNQTILDINRPTFLKYTNQDNDHLVMDVACARPPHTGTSRWILFKKTKKHYTKYKSERTVDPYDSP